MQPKSTPLHLGGRVIAAEIGGSGPPRKGIGVNNCQREILHKNEQN